MNKEEIDFILEETIKLHSDGYGTISQCMTLAKESWKLERRIRYKNALKKLFPEVKA